MDQLSIMFDYEGEVSLADSEEILTRISDLHRKVVDGQKSSSSLERQEVLRGFAANLERAFYGFEPDFFQQNLIRIVDDVISQFKGSLEIWPTLVEICYLHKNRAGLPMRAVENQALSPATMSQGADRTCDNRFGSLQNAGPARTFIRRSIQTRSPPRPRHET